ncbi:velvet factor-domain-containing protein [Myxozyma melibiosi]|uniref:Velvet factor-domain-containing protein n=1 Tax=Myxozyma melibiosi TaxID=54550 RepID=A0ABR1F498_9ASCO
MPPSPPSSSTGLSTPFSYHIYPGISQPSTSAHAMSQQPLPPTQQPAYYHPQQQPPPPPQDQQYPLPSHKQYLLPQSQQHPYSPQGTPPPQPYAPYGSYSQQQPPQQHAAMAARPVFDDPKEPYIYTLKVVQQPIRARMCGFGDKDRRPITPPPCIQLIITDKATGREADIAKLDVSFFALTVELWSVDETTNLSIVSTLPLSSGSGAGPQRPSYNNMSPPPQSHHASQVTMHGGQRVPTPTFVAPPIKNLIGSVVATAFKLHDPQGNLGVWFILQDLSVRTEGEFKLKASFVNLGSPLVAPGQTNELGRAPAHTSSSLAQMHYQPEQDSSLHNGQPVMVVNTGTANIQATCFSQPFKVYIAKKFPGVIESTDLSRCFAMQGIKIPIRKDQKKNGNSNGNGSAGAGGNDNKDSV